MVKYIKTGSLGLLISFLGSLPFGTLNITAFYIASKQNAYEALWFAMAVVLVELIVVRLTLWGDNRIELRGRLLQYTLLLGGLLLLYLAASTFTAIGSQGSMEQGAKLFPAIRSSFLLGLLLSVLNPMHIPFWMSWNRVLSSKNTLSNNWKSYTYYIGGIGIGTMFALSIFIFAGNYIFRNFNQYDMIINVVLSLIYCLFAFYLFVLFYKKRVKSKQNYV